MTPAKSPDQLLLSDHARLQGLFAELLDAFAAGHQRELRETWGAFEQGLLTHLDTEERLVLPPFAEESPEEAAALRVEHEVFRRLLAELGVGVDLHVVSLAVARLLVSRLQEHARREEALLYRWAGRRLDASARAAVAAGLGRAPQRDDARAVPAVH